MPTFVLGGVSLGLDANGDFNGTFNTTVLTLTLPQGASPIYNYGAPIPGDDFVPPAIFGPENPSINASPYGLDPGDEVFFANLFLDNGTVLTVMIITDDLARTDNIFVLASSDPTWTFPTDISGFQALDESIASVAPVFTGPFAAGSPIDFSAIFPGTLIFTTDNDVWVGTDSSESFDGGVGNDTLSGGGGNDLLLGGDGNDSLEGGSGDDDLFGGAGNDTINGGDGDRDEVWGLAGNDVLMGGAGTRDDLRYDRDAENGGTSGVNVNLASGIAIDGFGNTDTISGFERVRGTQFNDTLIGDGGNNLIRGWAATTSSMAVQASTPSPISIPKAP